MSDHSTRLWPGAGGPPRWLPIAIGVAAGFLAGVLLVAVLGGAQPVYKERTLTVAERPTGTAVPTLQGERLDRALDKLQRAGLKGDVQGGGLFGVLEETNWFVSGQDPSPGARLQQGDTVRVQIDRG